MTNRLPPQTMASAPGRFVLLLALCAAPAAGPAEDAGAPQMLDPAEQPHWTAIGRLNRAGYRGREMCSATLVAPDRVLTAAHCVLGPGDRPVDPASLHFVAGWFRDNYAALAGIAEIELPEGVAAEFAAGHAPLDRDLALLTLTTPLAGIPPLSVAAADPAQPGRILAYRRDRANALSDSGPCPVAARGHLLVADCPVTFGSSGGPLLQRDATGWQVVGVVSAMLDGGGTAVAPAAEWLSGRAAPSAP